MYGKCVDIVFANGDELIHVLCEREPITQGGCYVVRLNDGRECHIMLFESMTECTSENIDENQNEDFRSKFEMIRDHPIKIIRKKENK